MSKPSIAPVSLVRVVEIKCNGEPQERNVRVIIQLQIGLDEPDSFLCLKQSWATEAGSQHWSSVAQRFLPIYSRADRDSYQLASEPPHVIRPRMVHPQTIQIPDFRYAELFEEFGSNLLFTDSTDSLGELGLYCSSSHQPIRIPKQDPHVSDRRFRATTALEWSQ